MTPTPNRPRWLATLLAAVLTATMTLAAPPAIADPPEPDWATPTPPPPGIATQEAAAGAAFGRILGAAADRFDVVVRPATDGVDRFHVAADGAQIRVTATTAATAVRGLNTYLGTIGQSVSYTVRNVDETATFPAPASPITGDSNVPHRFWGNDTEDGYTGAYRTFEDWERLIDDLAALGFNQVFMPVGAEAVYVDVLQQFGYTKAEVLGWLPTPSHQPWWLLQNMSSFPDGLTEAGVEARASLGGRIADRLRELGMTPVLPGYFGTVPVGFAARHPGSNVVSQGGWVGFTRSDWLDPNDALFGDIAAAFYDAMDTRLGASDAYKMDLLHEGGQRGDVDVPAATRAVEAALQTAHPGALWVLLGWQNNPPADVATAADPGTTFIVDGLSDRYPGLNREADWSGVPYAFGTIWNFGGDTAMGAEVTTWNQRYFEWLDRPGSMVRGIAAIPEGGNNNAAALDFFANLAWADGPLDLDQWWSDWSRRRYGRLVPEAAEAWRILGRTAYSLDPDDGFSEPHDSLYAAAPSLTARTSSAWSPTNPTYDMAEFATALPPLLAAGGELGSNAAYRYDLMDVARQVLSNTGRVLLPKLNQAFGDGRAAGFERLRGQWLENMALIDQLAGTQEISLLGRLLDEARDFGTSPAEGAAFERSQRTLLTIWGQRPGFNAGLGDYAGREVQGLVGTYYLPRWRFFLDAKLAELQGGTPVAGFDWFDDGLAWSGSPDRAGILSAPTGDVVALAAQVPARWDLASQVVRPDAPGAGTHYLSDLPFLDQTYGLFPTQRDVEVGDGSGTNRPITMNSVVYEKGLGMQTPATVSFALDATCTRFTAIAGIDDTMSGPDQHPSIIFRVHGDGRLLWESGILRRRETAPVDLDVTGVTDLTLEVDPAVADDQHPYFPDPGTANWWDRGDWGDARVTCQGPTGGPTPTVTVTATTTATATQTVTATATATATATTTVTNTATHTATATQTPTATVTVTAPPPQSGPVDVYSTPGLHFVNGRHWATTCEPYSQTHRCRTEIWATRVRSVAGRYVSSNGWVFNNLTYLPEMTRAAWGANPLANAGRWTAADGRAWRTECDTAATGANACRSYVWSSFIASERLSDGTWRHFPSAGWVINNIVRFKP